MFAPLVSCLSAHLFQPEPELLLKLEAALSSGSDACRAHESLPLSPLRLVLEEKPELWDCAKRTLEWCDKNQAAILYPGHPLYPERLESLLQPPQFLCVRGDPCWLRREGLGVVGSREPTRYALEWMEQNLVPAMKATGIFSVSGGARGIDQKAHALTLRAGLPTIAFLPSGLAQVYPADFASWVPMILEAGGAVVSEYAPFVEMQKAHFHQRNRMIAALGCGLFVAEAARKSGSMMTARLALDANRPVCALPATPLESRAAGTVDLLFDGAQLVRDARDLAEFVRLNAKLCEG